MTAQIELLPADRIDLGLYADLQRQAFAAHLHQYDVDTGFMNEAYFRWKYSPPVGVGRIATAVLDGRYVASVAAIPLRVARGAREMILWRVMDIATDPEGRGRGLYSALLGRLKAAISEDEALMGFPNRNSTRAFEKAGGAAVCYVPTWVAPVLPLRRRHPAVTDLQNLEELDGGEWRDVLAVPVASSFVRDSRYLEWRYRRNPEYAYEIVVSREPAHSGLIVFRAAEVFGRPVVYILELWANTGRARARLLSAANMLGRRHRARAMLAVSNGRSVLQGARHGWLAVPRRFVPKEQILRVICGDACRAAFFDAWRVEMGDLPEF